MSDSSRRTHLVIALRFTCEVLEPQSLRLNLQWKLPESYAFETISGRFLVHEVATERAPVVKELEPYLFRAVANWTALPSDDEGMFELKLGGAINMKQPITPQAVFPVPNSHWGVEGNLTAKSGFGGFVLQGRYNKRAPEIGAIMFVDRLSDKYAAGSICSMGTKGDGANHTTLPPL